MGVMMKKIGILGGTFDPPHIGHILIAEEVRYALSLDEIWFIPTNVPPHKQTARTTSKHRLDMIQLAIDSNKYFKVNTIELARTGKSYTIDTMKILKQQCNHLFYFIIGADMVEYLPNWKQIDELMEMVQFVGVKRNTYQLETTYPIKVVDIPLIDISSSEIRRRIKEGEPFQYFLPEKVFTYIKEHHLYGFE